MSNRYKLANGISSPSPQRGGTQTQVTHQIDPSDDKDWEIINPDDYNDNDHEYEKNTPKMPKCGMSATGSFQIGTGKKKKEVFSFHVSTGSSFGNCGAKKLDKREASRRKGSQSSNREDDEETVVGEEEQFDTKEEILDEKGLTQKN